jgi:hypothetical protein
MLRWTLLVHLKIHASTRGSPERRDALDMYRCTVDDAIPSVETYGGVAAAPYTTIARPRRVGVRSARLTAETYAASSATTATA